MTLIPDTSLGRGLQARWEEVQNRFQTEKQLRRPEIDHIQNSSFNTPEEVLVDLQRLEQQGLDDHITRRLVQVYPCLESMRDCYLLLLKTPPALDIEMSFFYRLLHMVIMNAMNCTRIFARLVETLVKVRQDLVLIRECAPGITNSQELQTSIIESHVILSSFLVEAQKVCRGYTKDTPKQHIDTNITSDLLKLEKQFDEASERHNVIIKNIHRHSLLGASRSHVSNVASPLNTPESIEERDDVFPCHGCLPAKLPRFFGREDEFKLMDECFKAPVPDQNHTFALYGLGGTGKTSTALQYAWIRRDAYDAIFWIKSESTADIQASFIRMATALGLASEDLAKDSDNLSLRIRIWLQKTKKRWLLVYDNVEDAKVVESNMPTGNGHVLLTTRYKSLAIRNGACPHELEPLSPELSMAMFMGLCQMRDPESDCQSERAEIEKVLEEFGGLALAIEQIAAYVSLNNLDISTFRKRYNRYSKRIHAQNDASLNEKSLATLWSVQFDQIRGKRAEEVLGLLALLPVDTPRYLFCPQEDDEDDDISDVIDIPESDMDEALDHLHKVALIKTKADSVSIHRLVQKSFLETYVDPSPSRLQELFNKACKALNHRFPKSDTDWSHFGRWEACAQYLPHVLAVANLYYNRNRSKKLQLTMPEELLRLIRNAVWFEYETGNQEDALALLDIAYHGCADESSLDYAHLCSHGACVLYERNSVAKGQERINKALEIRVPRLDPWDGQLGNTFSNKGLLEASECRYSEALEFFDKSLVIREKLRNTYLAANYILRGMTLVLMGHLEPAKIDLEHAGRLCHEGGSKMEILNALRLFWLGNISLKQGEHQEARQFFQQALSIKAKKAPTHRLTASFFYKVAVVDLEQGDVEQAINNLDAANEISSQRGDVGEEARILRLKAMALRQRPSPTAGDIDEAREYETFSKATLENFLQDKDQKFRSLSEDEQYGLLVCAERR